MLGAIVLAVYGLGVVVTGFILNSVDPSYRSVKNWIYALAWPAIPILIFIQDRISKE